jgi:hypothetical protein
MASKAYMFPDVVTRESGGEMKFWFGSNDRDMSTGLDLKKREREVKLHPTLVLFKCIESYSL